MKYKIFLLLGIIFLLYQVNTGSLLGFIFDGASTSVLADSQDTYTDPYKDVPLHGYDWDKLTNASGRMEYEVIDGFKPTQGVDVSKYQGEIDWNKVKASGISFALLRAGYRGYESGIITFDEKFIQNLEQTKAAGIDVGIYFFSQAVTEDEAVEEAQFVLANIKDYQISYPIIFDLEEISASDHRTFNLTQEERTNIAIAFCETIENSGYEAMIYGNASWLTDCYDLNQIKEYDLWLAQYSDVPTFPYDFKMWQYTNQGYVDGIDHVVDLNLCFVPYVLFTYRFPKLVYSFFQQFSWTGEVDSHKTFPLFSEFITTAKSNFYLI